MSTDDEALPGTSDLLADEHGVAGDVYAARSIAQVRGALQHLHARRQAVTDQLDALIAEQDDLARQLRRLDLARARLGSVASNARAISNDMLFGAASTAGQISDNVERLDLEQERVKATLAVVEQVAELKACVLGVVGSMGGPQDWEAAAEYISRASKIPPKVIHSGFAERIVPTAEVPDPPSVTLESSAESLCQLFLREFQKAVEESDSARITRFFKMFPLIGRSKEGLDAYGNYVCHGVAVRARGRLQTSSTTRRDGYYYATALTKLFEHIAQVIDGHSPLVERHYGAGTMTSVMQRLHREADVQGGIILDTWSDERKISKKLTEVRSYAYSFLVQSFLSVPKGGTPRAQSPAKGSPSGRAAAAQEDGLEMKEVDQLLGEIGAMLGHWSLYLRFVSSRATPSKELLDEDEEPKPLAAPQFVTNSNLPSKVSKLLVDPFNTFATYFLRRSVEKAFQLEEAPSGLSLNLAKPITANAPFITSAVDDVMYVVNQMLQRALATSQAQTVAATTSTIGRVLGSDFIGMLQRKMKDECYPKGAVEGAMPPEDLTIQFLVCINNLDTGIDYVKRIVREPLEGASMNGGSGHGVPKNLADLYPMGNEAEAVKSALQSMEGGFQSKASELLNDGLTVVFRQVMRPRMRPLLADAFRDTDYSSEEPHTTYQNGDYGEEVPESKSVRARAGHGWDLIVKPMKRILSEKSYDRLLTMAISHLSNLLERRIRSYYGRVSEIGAVNFERDVVDIANVAVKGENFKLREMFSRCIQTVTIMNLDEEEWEALEAIPEEDPAFKDVWILSKQECAQARTIVKGRE